MAEENVHKDHRQRLRNKYISQGTDFFEKHELLELLLFYAVSRRDTNFIGHGLIERFSNIAGVLEAEKAELKKVSGVGDHTAEFIKLIGDIVSEYRVRNLQNVHMKFGKAEGMRFARQLFADNPSESRMYMMVLGANDSLLSVELLARGDYSYEDISIRDVVSRVINIDATRVVLAHNHPGGSLLPSDGDIKFSREMERALSYIDIELNDHILVAGSTAVSIRYDILRKKSDNGLTSAEK